jgi:long-chain acyl-CoA synthetase
MNLATNLERSAFYFPDRPALSENFPEITYAQLNDRANRIATALIKLGVNAGDPVGLFAPNSSDWITVYFGILKMGAVAVTTSSVLTRDEMHLLLNHSRPKFLFTYDEKLDDLAGLREFDWLEKVVCPNGDIDIDHLIEMGDVSFKAVDRDRSDTAVILYTGGTTGIPKGVMLTHENVNTAIQNVRFHERSLETDRALLFLPLNHVFGQMHIMNATILSAGCLEMIPAFDPEQVLDLMSNGRVTRFLPYPLYMSGF